MTKTVIKTSFLLILGFFGFVGIGNAQADLDELFNGIQTSSQEEVDAGVRDANKLIEGYVDPFMKGFGAGMLNGWNNTAKVHKKFGVELTITANLAFVPDEDLFYTPGDLGLERISLNPNSPNEPQAPTLFGPAETPIYDYEYTDPITNLTTTQTFDGPPGADLEGEIGGNFVPVPMAHLGIGVPVVGDVKFRFIPSISLGDDTKMKMFGVGVLHDIKQHIPVIKNMPFSLSAFVGYTKLDVDSDLDAENNPGQQAHFDMNGFTVQALISKKLSVVTFYGGIGYNNLTSKLGVVGEYDIDDDGSVDFTDPVNLKFTSNGARATVGMRLKLWVFTFHGDYTFQEYNTLSVGFGINVRD